MRFAAYSGASLALATGVVIRALHQRANFYSACVYLAQSNACLMILTNVALLGVSIVMLGLQKVFYGPLRPIELEQLYEKAWFAITETCLAMTIFREEVGGWFLIMFVSLLMGKVWGWVSEGRVEILEQQPPSNPLVFHARLSLSLFISVMFDGMMLLYSTKTVLRHARPNMMVMFAFEFAVLLVSSMSTMARYAISLRETAIIRGQTDSRRAQLRRDRQSSLLESQQSGDGVEALNARSNIASPHHNESQLLDNEPLDLDVPGWEDKGRWIFYLDLLTDFSKLILYLTFFCVLCVFYGMPIHIIRDVALTIRSFHKRIVDFIRYRQATRDMHQRYPDATQEEINREDCCIICREEMVARPQRESGILPNPGEADITSNPQMVDDRLRPKKLPCGHVLHFACLRSWLERQQNCPTCRANVIVPVQAQALQLQQPIQQGAGALIHGAGNRQGNGQEPGVPRMPDGYVAPQNAFRLGPIRFAFGGRFRPLQTPQQPPTTQPRNLADQRHGIDASGDTHNFTGIGQAPATAHSAVVDPMHLSIHIQTMERVIIQAIENLRLQADQLYIVHALQNEYVRLRHRALEPERQYPTYQPVSTTQMFNMPSQGQPLPLTQQVYMSDDANGRLEGRLQGLPEGIVIPPGWTLSPLRHMSSTHGVSPDLRDSNTAMTPLGESRTFTDHQRSDTSGSQYTIEFTGSVPSTVPLATQMEQTQQRRQDIIEPTASNMSENNLSPTSGPPSRSPTESNADNRSLQPSSSEYMQVAIEDVEDSSESIANT